MVNKKIKLTEEAYNILVKYKKPEESFSDCVLRRYGKKKIAKNQRFES
jgi:predicted CopG family antitoxin